MRYEKGYLEGAMTQKRIYQQYTNIHSVFWHNATTIPASLQAWLKAQVRGGPLRPLLLTSILCFTFHIRRRDRYDRMA
jgi:hypothetical protein